MRTWVFHQPDENGQDIKFTYTEEQILAEYWEHWSGKMKELGRGPITKEACIDDWIVVNWAQEEKDG